MAFLDEAGLAELWSLVKGRVATGSYVGTGKYGFSNPTTLTFDFVPKALIVCKEETYMSAEDYTRFGFWITGLSQLTSFDASATSTTFVRHLSVDGTTISWYNDNSSSGPANQMNTADATYRYIAIG